MKKKSNPILSAFLMLILANPLVCFGSEAIKAWIAAQADADSLYAEFLQERSLRNVKTPLKSIGKLYFKDPGSFRWEAGELPNGIPLKAIAVKNQKEVITADVEAKTANRYTIEEIQDEGRAQGFVFLENAFPRDFASFDKNFKVTSESQVNQVKIVKAEPRNNRVRRRLTEIAFAIKPDTNQLQQLSFALANGTRVDLVFTKITQNPKLPDNVFKFDLTGYTVEKK